MNLRILLALPFLIATITSAHIAPAWTQEESAKPDKAEAGKKDKDKPEKVEPKVFTHDASGTFGGERINYLVTAGETFLKNDKGDDTAAIFTVAYTKKDVSDARTRPVTFIFNGGPGSASLWLHMGVFGPKRIVVPSDG